MTAAALTRRTLLRTGAAGAAAAAMLVAGAAGPAGAATTEASDNGDELGGIYVLQAAFHRAKSHQDIDLMVSLWTRDCTFTNAGTLYSGQDAVRSFFLATGSWLNHRISLVPSFKDQIQISGRSAYLYFECHDVDAATGLIVAHAFNAGNLRQIRGGWLFHEMHFGPASPLSADTIYYP